MNVAPPPATLAPAQPAPGGWRLPARLALAEARGGLGALRLLFVCLFLGVVALAGVGSLAAAIQQGLAAQGQVLLGADIEARLTQRLPTEDEDAYLASLGTVSRSVRMRAMVRGESGAADGRQLLAELKAVDGRWPLYGEAALASALGNAAVQDALGRGAVVAEALATQLGLAVGDTISLGQARFPVSGILTVEPDRVGEGFTLGPTVMIALDRLDATGLVQPGSLYRHHTRIALPAAADPAAVRAQIEERFPDAGWRLADRRDGAPGVRRFVERLAQFLTLVSLTALAVAGVGVANGVASFLDSRAATIATLKVLGASTSLVFRAYLLLVLGVGVLAAAAGLLVGALAPPLVARLAADALPVPPAAGLYAAPLLAALAFGLLVAVAFAILPLARACALPVARVFRARAEAWPWPSRRALGLALGVGALIVALALAQSVERLFALGFLGGALAVLGLLFALGQAIVAVARRLPRPTRLLPRLALANLHRPGALTRQLVVALGLGLSLFATLAFIETSFEAELRRTVPDRAPGYFLLDLPREEAGRFRAALPPGTEVELVPSLRGPLTAVNDVPVSELPDVPAGSWILRGDRGITYAAELPAGNRLTAGQWWPADYDGEPLVSLDAEQAALLGLDVGDHVTVSVLGVEIRARIASLRQIDWESLGFNFVLVFDPATLADAPFTWMATVTPPPEAEAGFTAAITRAFPTVSVVRVADVIEQVGALARQMGTAVRWAAAVAILAGIAVLVGALAAQARQRTADTVILKTLGATRRQLVATAAIEYAVLGAIVAAVALLIGGVASFVTLALVFDLGWRPHWPTVLGTVGAGALVTLGLGLLGARRTLGVRVARVLRQSAG